MTIDLHGSVGASSAPQTPEWDSLDWAGIRAKVRRLQMRIAKAIRTKRYGQAYSAEINCPGCAELK